MSSKKRSSTIKYDSRAGRFRGPNGRFVSYDKGIRSRPARETYKFVVATFPAVATYVRKPKPSAPRKTPGKRALKYSETGISGRADQRAIYIDGPTTRPQIAALIWRQIKAGADCFRFWYRMPVSSGYANGIGSTMLMTMKNQTYKKVLDYLMQRGRIRDHTDIRGDIVHYWFGKCL